MPQIQMKMNDLANTPSFHPFAKEELENFIEEQLERWEMAKQNYSALKNVRRRNFEVRPFPIYVQFNPARKVSTAAKIDNGRVSDRPCFLCASNRPEEQLTIPILEGWDLLVNPFPIFPVHFTISSTVHRPQSAPPEDMIKIAELLPGMVVFFNGACAGASAPDHLHLQAVLKDELPLVRYIEQAHPIESPGIKASSEFNGDLPFFFFSGVVVPSEEGLKTLLQGLALGGPDKDGKFTDQRFLNLFFWIDESSHLRFISIPRKAHRPECYYAKDSSHRLVSPGCIDMTGLIITPDEKDFSEISLEEINRIFSDVAIMP